MIFVLLRPIILFARAFFAVAFSPGRLPLVCIISVIFWRTRRGLFANPLLCPLPPGVCAILVPIVPSIRGKPPLRGWGFRKTFGLRLVVPAPGRASVAIRTPPASVTQLRNHHTFVQLLRRTIGICRRVRSTALSCFCALRIFRKLSLHCFPCRITTSSSTPP